MKKLHYILFAVASIVCMTAMQSCFNKETTDQPKFDPAFLAWCLDPAKGNLDTDGDGLISEEEILATTLIGCEEQSLTSLRGIWFFTNLTTLSCYGNQLTELDVSKNKALTYLDCYTNSLTKLDVSHNKELADLECGDNQLKELDVSQNTKLLTLFFYNNQLTDIDLSKNTLLTSISCSDNKLSELNLTNNTALDYLNCDNNKLTELDLKRNSIIYQLECVNNPDLATIDISGSSFTNPEHFDCTGIKAGAKILVWSGFNSASIPEGWEVPGDINWVVPTP